MPLISQLPPALMLNAYTGRGRRGGASGALSPHCLKWIMQEGVEAPIAPKKLWSDDESERDDTEWDESKNGVGWSILLPLDKNHPLDCQPAVPNDAPPAIQELWKSRNEPPIYRFDPQDRWLIRCSKTGICQPVAPAHSPLGCSVNSIPYYVLISRSRNNEIIPWDVQFLLNGSRAVGRLDLPDPELSNYVHHLMNDWRDCRVQGTQAVIWAVDHHETDITRLMAEAITEKIHFKIAGDKSLKAEYFRGEQATHQQLCSALAKHRPGFILTTSHGSIDLQVTNEERAKRLGNLVDQNFAELSGSSIGRTDVGGAIWYAHACCSAGCSGMNRYENLLTEGTDAERCVSSAVKVGSRTATFPQTLLGREQPLRAFVGKIDPTFDWTIRDPVTQQHLTEGLVMALYKRFLRQKPVPIGWALRRWFDELSGAFTSYDDARMVAMRPSANDATAVRTAGQQLLILRDLQSTVILGDPTVKRAYP